MTDNDPIDEVEVLNGMRNVARMARAFYEELLAQGFDAKDALVLTGGWLHGVSGGRHE